MGWETFNKYYSNTDDFFLYAAVHILHPNRRTKYIEANWKAKCVRPVLEKVKGLWESYREKAPTLISSSYKRKSQEQELDEYDRIFQKLKKRAQPASQDEYQDYCNGELCDIGEIPALEWW